MKKIGKKATKTLRKRVGYDANYPDCCKLCIHFTPQLKTVNEFNVRISFPPRCEKHTFAVEEHAICDHFHAKL